MTKRQLAFQKKYDEYKSLKRKTEVVFRRTFKVGNLVIFRKGNMKSAVIGEILTTGSGFSLEIRNLSSLKVRWIYFWDLI